MVASLDGSRFSSLLGRRWQPAERKRNPSKPPALRVYRMSLWPGDILADEVSEWRAIGHPYTSAGGKIGNVRCESTRLAGVVEVRARGAHEQVAVKPG